MVVFLDAAMLSLVWEAKLHQFRYAVLIMEPCLGLNQEKNFVAAEPARTKKKYDAMVWPLSWLLTMQWFAFGR